MPLLYYSPTFLDHKTQGHPERPERIVQTVRHLERLGLDQLCIRPDWQPISLERLARVHSLQYVHALEQFCAAGGGQIEQDTLCSPQSYDVARLAAGAACDAVERVLRGEARSAVCLQRPPGHHALADGPMGFCLFNHVALAARLATTEFQLNRVLIVDWDVHHGNGTQEAFWRDPQVGFLSIHRWPFYPGTGSRDETGSGPAIGTKVNLPVEFGIARSRYLDLFRGALERLAAQLQPELILLSAGFDSHRDDPIGSLGLETEDFGPLTEYVLEIAREYAGGRVVSVLEGGYNPGILAGCIELHVRTLLAAEQTA